MVDVSQENLLLMQQISEYEDDERRMKDRLIEHLLHMRTEQEFLQSKIKFVKDQIAQFSLELDAYKKRNDSFGAMDQLQWDEEGEIKAGSKEKLVECLYVEHKSKQTYDYTSVFMLTYRYFVTTREVIDELTQGYNRVAADVNSPECLKCRLKIINLLKKWVTDDFEDFMEDQIFLSQESLDKLQHLINNMICKVDNKIGITLKQTLDAKMRGLSRRQSQAMFSDPAPPAILPRMVVLTPGSNPQIQHLLDINPLEVARQMTLVDYSLCKAIRSKECLGLAWTKKDKEVRSPNLLKMIYRFNHVSRWVAATLVSEPNLKRRSKLLSHFVSVMGHLKELNNFNAIFQVIGGLGNSSVHRLSKSFALLKPEKKKILEEMKVLTDPVKSWANYRRTIHEVNPPCVPFIGVYQTDLTFIEDGNPDKFSTTGLVNFKKCRLVAMVIEEIQQYQQKPYNLHNVSAINEFFAKAFEDAQKLDDKQLYSLSLAAEPRAAN